MDASSPEQQPSGSALSIALPADGHAKEFAQNLLDSEITDFSPVEGVYRSPVEFVYETLTFSGDGTWAAAAAV